MNILILNWRCPKNPNSGGAEIVTMVHAKAWLNKGWEVVWLSGGYTGAKKEEIIEGIKIVRYGNSLSIYLLAPFIYWFKYFGKFDLIIDQLHGFLFLTPLWAFKSKVIAFVHEVAQEIWDEMWHFPINFLGKVYEKIYLKFYRNTQFIVDCKSTQADLYRYGINKNKVAVVPCAIDLKPTLEVPLKEKELTIMFCSRLVKMKGIEDAIKIFSLVKALEPKAVFWIIGGGSPDYVNRLKILVADLQVKDVNFFGWVKEDEKVKHYQKSHFLIHTSVREGFGLVVLEANSQGTPIISYDSPGLRDIVRNDINGYQFSKGNEQQMAVKMVELYRNKKAYQKLAKSSIEEVKRYSWAKSTKQFIDVIEGVIDC